MKYEVVNDLINLPEEYRKYALKDGRNHNYIGMKKDVGPTIEKKVIEIYRPFDIR